MYQSFYKHSIYEYLLQQNMLICTYFSLNELHFHYNKQLIVLRSFLFVNAEKWTYNAWGGGDLQ
jgi:hypothetical protein